MFQHIYGAGVCCVCTCLRVCMFFFFTHVQHISIGVPKMLQPPLPQRHPHVLCSLTCLISRHSLTHHHTDVEKEEKNIACFSSSPQWSHMARVQCSIWAVPLKIINICLFDINKLECATQNHDRDGGESGVFLSGEITLNPPADGFSNLCLPLSWTERRQRKQRLCHTLCWFVIQSVGHKLMMC